MKNIVRRTLVAGAFFAALSVPGISAAQTRIKLGTLLPKDTSQYQSLERMSQEWRAKTNGAVTLTIYPGGVMGTEEESIQKMRIGQLQAVTLSASGLADIDPYIGAVEKVPMLFRSMEEAEYIRGKIAPQLESRLEQKGYVVLFWADAGWIQVFSRRPVVHPSDLKGMRLLTTPGDPNEAELIRSLGIVPVERSWGDALVGLQTGAVDTIVTTPFLCLAGQFYRSANHYLALNYVPLDGATIMSKKVWDSLTPEQRQAMREAASKAGKEIQNSSRSENETSIAAMKRLKLQEQDMTPEMEAEWRSYFEAVYPKVRGKLVPEDILDQVQKDLAQYRSTKNSSGGR